MFLFNLNSASLATGQHLALVFLILVFVVFSVSLFAFSPAHFVSLLPFLSPGAVGQGSLSLGRLVQVAFHLNCGAVGSPVLSSFKLRVIWGFKSILPSSFIIIFS